MKESINSLDLYEEFNHVGEIHAGNYALAPIRTDTNEK